MIYVKNRLITGLISKTIKKVLTAVYKVLSLFNLQIPLAIAVFGAILFITGALENESLKAIIIVALVLSTVGALLTTLNKVFGSKKPKTKKSTGIQIIQQQPQSEPQQEQQEVVQTTQATQTIYPKYFTVKQNRNYIMGEFADRYELYLKTDRGLKLVRTDYKNQRTI